MHEQEMQALEDVFIQVLETQAFMFADIPEEAPETPAEELVAVRISFSGNDKKGHIELMASEDFCCEVVANVIGIEPDEECARGKSIDSVKEIVNVICGNFLTTAYGEDIVFDITIPEGRKVESGEWTEKPGENAKMYLVDDFPVMLKLFISGTGN